MIDSTELSLSPICHTTQLYNDLIKSILWHKKMELVTNELIV